jgi:hypothetical protein
VTAEEIAQQFPSVPLAGVYLIIAYYLERSREVDEYLSRRRADAELLEHEVEAQLDPVGLRARLMARQKSR